MASTIDLMMNLKDGVSPKLGTINNHLAETSGKAKAVGRSITSLGSMMKGVFVGGAIASFVTTAMKAYDTQVLAEKSLQRSIMATGATAERAKADLDEWKDFASKQQDLTAFGDEDTIARISDLIGQGFGKKDIKDIVAMSQDIARGTGDTQENVTKTLAQYIKTGKGANRLAKQYKMNAELLGEGATEAERLTEVWTAFEKAGYKGSAGDYLKTFSGQLEAVQGRLADFNEPLGELFQTLLGFDTKGNFGEQLDATIKSATSDIQNMTNRAKELGGGITGIGRAAAEAHPILSALIGVIISGKTLIGLAEFGKAIYSIGTAIKVLTGISAAAGSAILILGSVLAASIVAMNDWLRQSVEVRNELDRQDAQRFGVTGNEAEYYKSRGINMDLSGSIGGTKAPHNALGTSYFKGGSTYVNEGNRGELITLPSGSQVIPADKTDKMLNGNNININLNIDGNVIGNEEFINQIGDTIFNRVSLAVSNI